MLTMATPELSGPYLEGSVHHVKVIRSKLIASPPPPLRRSRGNFSRAIRCAGAEFFSLRFEFSHKAFWPYETHAAWSSGNRPIWIVGGLYNHQWRQGADDRGAPSYTQKLFTHLSLREVQYRESTA
jgi:hypothetical protein